ncbi:UNKNOWN [Stylonychia lemnae]|uniref:Uncharacterized protein n=1 Tax=Stylonychia lemnae TaxID=5949 RepID=A0A078AS86_STYLE|nr:UNKNOWN [Stylonychia lemnae]|eukprot:CDW83758.1 UNKNOWN [Stylonychia lemnae]
MKLQQKQKSKHWCACLTAFFRKCCCYSKVNIGISNSNVTLNIKAKITQRDSRLKALDSVDINEEGNDHLNNTAKQLIEKSLQSQNHIKLLLPPPSRYLVTGEDENEFARNLYGKNAFGFALAQDFKLPEIKLDNNKGKFEHEEYEEEIRTTEMNRKRNMKKRKPKAKKTRATRIDNHKLREPQI